MVAEKKYSGNLILPLGSGMVVLMWDPERGVFKQTLS